ncbi:AraC family transcriptional regulator [Telluria beijingensis]|uniref:AraC family transcriptional regulator n=1 Tax=Telluria beijingensis TaxID=3068633 RepID=UPI002796297C|nr:AraC family transcriptional regulator [Massilia sp. REN29]
MANDSGAGDGIDTLSRLLSLFTLRTSLDIRCALAAPWVLEQPAATPGVAPYHLIVEGEAAVDTPTGERIALHAGDIVVFPQGGAHRLHAGPPERAQPLMDVPGPAPLRWVANGGDGAPTGILCGQFVFDEGARRVLQPALPAVIVVHASTRPDFAGLLALVTMLRSEADSARPGAAAVVEQLSGALFTLLLRAWLDDGPTTPGLLAVLADRRLGAALRLMLAQPERPWLVEDLAAACFMSRATFARLFRQLAGTTPLDALVQLRMTQAAQWLARDTRPVAAIGYQSEAAFNRVFKRSYGVGPGAWRRAAMAASR